MDKNESNAAVLGSLQGVTSLSGRKTKIVNSIGSFTEAPTPPNISKRNDIKGDSQNEKNDTCQEDNEDEEIRIAMKMALAMKNNPNLSPEEIRRLVGAPQSEQQQNIAAIVASKKEKEQQQQLIPGLLSNKFLAFKDEDESKIPKSFSTPKTKNNIFSAANFQHNINKTMQGIVGGTATTTSLIPEKKNDTSFLPVDTARESPILEKSERSEAGEESINADGINDISESMPQDSTTSNSEGGFLLSSHVWKRRSGFGKYNQKAWERRRIVLKGCVLQYFRIDTLDGDDESKSAADDDEIFSKDTTDSSHPKQPNWLTMNIEKAKANVEKNIEKARANVEKNVEKAKANMEKFATTITNEINLPFLEDDPNAPRGVLDLIKESATVGAAMGHSGSPTPYCLSIKVGKETKWKLCFDTHELQMKWLGALTDIIVKSSVDGYNEVSSAKSLEDNSGESESNHFPKPESWKLDNYLVTSSFKIKSDELIEKKTVILPETESEKDVNIVRELIFENDNEEMGSQSVESPVEKGIMEDQEIYFKISQTDLCVAAAIVNTALIFTQMSSSTPNRFWHIATFANLGLYLLLTKQNKVENKVEERKGSALDMVSSEKSEQPVKLKPVEVEKAEKRDKYSAYRPRAGSTTMEIKSLEDVPVKNNKQFIGWRRGENLCVRSHSYFSTKEKIPSIGTMYEVVAVDILKCKKRIRDLSSRVTLPTVAFEEKDSKRWHAPDIFVVTISLPTDSPSAFKPSNDGGCATITMYYRMREETRKVLEHITSDDDESPKGKETEEDAENPNVNAIKLFNEWCRRAPGDDKYMSRFKLIFTGDNFKEIGIPSYIRNYNGKPVLIKRPGQTGFLYNHPEQRAMEFEISLHPFPYLAKQAIYYLNENFFQQLVLTIGFLIESRAQDELPECLIGSTQISRPDPNHSIEVDRLFDGTSPKSHDD